MMKASLTLHRSILLVLVLSLAGSGLVMGFQSVPQAAASGFAYRCGVHFCIDGQPFYFAGANTYDVFTFGDGSSSGSPSDIETRYMDKARIDAHFARLQADKVTVLRLWMFSHETWHGFEIQEGIYNEAQFMLFDYIIESAKAHDVMLIPVFENYWEAYGGIDTRLAWEGLTGGHPGRWKFFNKNICPGCFTSYKNYVGYVLNRTNHYSGIKYKDEPAIFAWELMNEPRYQDATPNENSSGTTLRAWVDEMGAYIKNIDPNHMLGTGLEGHEARYGFGGDEGNPFIYIHQSPYVDFTSAHPYPTETWANLSIAQTRALVRAWITDSHDVVGKPFYLGEFNTHTGVRTDWWTAIFDEMEINDGDGTGFWWYQDHAVDSKFGVSQGAPELAVFRQHSDDMRAKSGPRPTRTPSPTPDPTRILKVQYMTMNTGATSNQITAYLRIVNTGVGLQSVPLSELRLRYWYTTDTTVPDQYGCLYAGNSTPGCANITATVVPLNPPRPNADRYLELSFSAAAGSILPYGSSSDIQNRLNKSDWSGYTQSNDYSFDATKTAFADWNHVTLYRNGVLVWGVEPGGSTTPTFTPTFTNTPGTPPITPSYTSTVTPTRTNTPTFTSTFTPTQPIGNNTGWISPSGQTAQSGGDGNGFQTSPTNAFADGGGVATDTDSGTGTSTSCTSTSKDRQAYFNYPLSIPSGSSISGIEVRTDARADSTSGAPHFCVQLSWNNGTSWTTLKTGPTLATTERTDSLGSASDTWGRAWNTNELTSSNFRVRIVSVSSSTSRDFFLDWVPVRVWYSSGPTPPPTDTPTSTPTFTATPTPTGTITSRPTFIIEGHVRLDSSSGPGVPGIPIAVWFGGPHGQVTTDANGYYRVILPIPPNQETTSVVPQSAGYVFSPERYDWIVLSYDTGPFTRDFIASALTPTPTPTATGTSGPNTLRLQYRAADANAGDNQIKPHFNILNVGTTAVPLSELKIRYWFTREGTQNQNFWCDWSAISGSCSNVSGTFIQLSPARSGADFYLEVSFAAAAGAIPVGGWSGEIQTRISKSDWSNYLETGDYSFDPTKTSFTDWTHVTLYRNGVLIWGVEP